MYSLWSMSTTVREAERIKGFLNIAKKIESLVWNLETQRKFQILLVQFREYLNDPTNGQSFQKLNSEQIKWLTEKETDMPYKVAESIIDSKNYVGGAEMRGRQSMSPLRKLGLVYITSDNKICVSDVGNKFINDEITYEEFFLDSLIKIQYPNPLDDSYSSRNIKPFIAILHLINKVNNLCETKGMKVKGISKDELGIFGLSIINYYDINDYANKLLEYRIYYESLINENDKKAYRDEFISTFLSSYNNPLGNYGEYSDNMIRYFRQTKLIYIRGKYENSYIDLEPRRKIEINEILEHDDAKPLIFDSEQEWIDYFSTYGSYELPYETLDNLQSILHNINNENYMLAEEVNTMYTVDQYIGKDKFIIKGLIDKARNERTKLQNIKIKKDYFDTAKIDETIQSLKYIIQHDKDKKLKNRLSLEFEKWANISLNIINDALLIKPNTIVGDDNEPINTAPGGMADIECYYNSFNCICEVTTLTSRDQWYNEGQPVMRHLREFEKDNNDKEGYCIFIAPRLHVDTINTFWNSVKYEYEGIKQKIIPITIYQLIRILEVVKKMHVNGKRVVNTELKSFLDDCSSVGELESSTEWLPSIDKKINMLA